MKRIDLCKTLGGAAVIGAALLSGSALADPSPAEYCPGYGMDGMMGGYGPGYGMGPEMMGGRGPGYGMGPGMMGGHGYGRGPAMMGGYGSGANLNLDAEQRRKIARIQDDLRHKHWELMGKMQDEQSRMSELFQADPRDDAALGKSYRTMSELRQQMFDLGLGAQKQIDSLLSKEQREKLRRAW